jgi:hypothetical protein
MLGSKWFPTPDRVFRVWGVFSKDFLSEINNFFSMESKSTRSNMACTDSI